ncbi:MAG: GntR family transcriptional regulator [Blastocatellia bacterium]|nr:GntR family transcriptional regulator [Blastocatellia bacterium]
MQFILDKNRKESLVEQAREQLLTALYMGKLRSGDRLPSVRQVASRNNINIKTAFTIYQHLKQEGYVELRAGAGAFVSDPEKADLDQAYHLSILRLIKSNLSQAGQLKLPPQHYVALMQNFVEKSRFKSVQAAMIECNEEQIRLCASELIATLNMRVFPVLLDRVERPTEQLAHLLAQMDYFITTDYHYKQVAELATRYDKKTLQVRLDPAYISMLTGAAHRGEVLMIVSDASFFPAFRKRLTMVGTPPAVIDNIKALDDTNLSSIRKAVRTARAVYVSPISHSRVREALPGHVEELKIDNMLSLESIEMIEAILLFHAK